MEEELGQSKQTIENTGSHRVQLRTATRQQARNQEAGGEIEGAREKNRNHEILDKEKERTFLAAQQIQSEGSAVSSYYR